MLADEKAMNKLLVTSLMSKLKAANKMVSKLKKKAQFNVDEDEFKSDEEGHLDASAASIQTKIAPASMCS